MSDTMSVHLKKDLMYFWHSPLFLFQAWGLPRAVNLIKQDQTRHQSPDFRESFKEIPDTLLLLWNPFSKKKKKKKKEGKSLSQLTYMLTD